MNNASLLGGRVVLGSADSQRKKLHWDREGSGWLTGCLADWPADLLTKMFFYDALYVAFTYILNIAMVNLNQDSIKPMAIFYLDEVQAKTLVLPTYNITTSTSPT